MTTLAVTYCINLSFNVQASVTKESLSWPGGGREKEEEEEEEKEEGRK